MVSHVGLRSTVGFGGIDMKPQTAPCARVSSSWWRLPAALLDHVQQKTLNLQQVEAFVLDEATACSTWDFIPDVRRIRRSCPSSDRNLLFRPPCPQTFDPRQLLPARPGTRAGGRLNTAAELVQHVSAPGPARAQAELLAYLVQSRDLRRYWSSLQPASAPTASRTKLERATAFIPPQSMVDKRPAERLQALRRLQIGKG